MPALDVSTLAEGITAHLARENPLLFAGAGVGCRVGLPTWYQYMEHLACACERFEDKLSAALIRQRTKDGQFLEAATVFKTCNLIPEGERWKELAAPFRVTPAADIIARLEALAGLGFTAMVTTNYDHFLHQASSRVAGWPQPIERDDGSLRGASLKRDFFIARIHGRAEFPTSIVIDNQDYNDLEHDDAYLDFLLDILKTRPCLFVGFSFVDPAIAQVLRTYKEKCGPTFEALHTALLPADAGDLAMRLREVNIQTLQYAPEKEHQDLWRSIRLAFDERRLGSEKRKAPIVPAKQQSAPIHRFMAFAYAQMRSSEVQQPLTTIIQDGIVLEVISSCGSSGMSEADIIKQIHPILRLSNEESIRVVRSSIQRLNARGQIGDTEGAFSATVETGPTLRDHLETLANSVLDRMRVRGQVTVHPNDLGEIQDILESVFISRAWDLAAHFAGAASGWGADLPLVVKQLVANHHNIAKNRREAVELATLDLLTAPEDRETRLLAKIGRAAFGLQLVISTPRQALFQKHSLPERIYLDTNVIMPAITSGHPLRPVYTETLRRLSEATGAIGQPLKITVGTQFLNEIISHRRIAVRLVEELGLEDPALLKKHILLYSATDTNVFIGAFASHVGREEKSLSFAEFLRQVAPFESEAELAEHLRELDIETMDMGFFDDHHTRFSEIFSWTKEGYEKRLSPRDRLKDTVLIEHEAQQMTQLSLDHGQGFRSLFVTADGKLRRVLQEDVRLHEFSGSTVSQLGLVALVDIMVGLEPDTRSLARLVWAAPRTDDEQTIFDYFVRLGLRRYEEGIAVEMEESARQVAAQASSYAERERIHLFGKTFDDVAATAKFLDRYEDKFFQNWREAVEKREKELRDD